MPAISKPWDTVFVLERAKETASVIIREIKRVRAKDFPYPLPRKLLDILLERADKRSTALSELDDDQVFWDGGTSQEDRLAQIRTLAAALAFPHFALSLVYAVDSTRIPFEIIRAFQRLAGKLLRPADQVQIMLKPLEQYNYVIVPLGQIDSRLDQDYLLGFPSADSSSLSVHTMFLHELAHPVFRLVRNELLSDIATALEAAESSLTGEIDAAVNTSMQSAGIQKPAEGSKELQTWGKMFTAYRKAVLDRAAEVTLKWVEEVFCDLCATRLAGPAYLCTYQAFALPFFSHTCPSEEHPDDWLRLQILRAAIARLSSLDEAFRDVCTRFGKYADLVNGIQGTNVSGIPVEFAVAHRVLRPSSDNPFIKRLFSCVDDRIPNPFAVEGFTEAMDRGLEGVGVCIPPDPTAYFKEGAGLEIEHIISYVFVVMWLFKLNHMDGWKKRYDWGVDRCNDALDCISIKALESAELAHSYVEAPRQ